MCDQWFASAPTETMPNRAFACAGTSQGHMDDKTHTFTSPTIFGLLSAAELGWAVYGYDAEPLTKNTFTDISTAAASHFGLFTDFQAAAAAGTLPPYTFLEPSWSSTGNSQHPNYDVALGEQLIHDVYEALRAGPGWPATLLVITYDEHGGCYDHVPPPWGAVPPDNDAGRVRLRLRPVRGARANRPGVPADRGRARCTGRRRRPAAGPHIDPEDRRAALEPARADRARRGRARLRRCAHAQRPADRRRAGRGDRPVASGPGPAAGTVSHLEEIREELVTRRFPAGVTAALAAGTPDSFGSALTRALGLLLAFAPYSGGQLPFWSTGDQVTMEPDEDKQ